MRIVFIGILALATCLTFERETALASGRELVDQEFLAEITSHIFCDRYDFAYEMCHRFIEDNPDDPYGYFLMTYTYMAEMTEQRENLYPDSFFVYIDLVKQKSNKILDSCRTESQAWYHCLIGNAWAYTSLWESRFGSSTKAYKVGSRADKHYRRALENDSSMYDAYAGLGAFHYWKSAKAGVLRTFGMIKDDRARGIRELRLAVDSSVVSRETARKTFITILIDNKAYDDAIILATEMERLYPGGRSFLWGLSRAYYGKQEFGKAVTQLQRYRERMLLRPGNYINLLRCDAQICRCYEKLGQKDLAGQWATHLNDYIENVSPAVLRAEKKNIKYLKKLLKSK